MKIGTIILAAGGSTRLGGQAKQLIEHDGQTLVQRITDAALSLTVGPVTVVLGAQRDRIAAELANRQVTIIDNPLWQSGLASSLKIGLAALYLTQKDIDAVLILLTDQPHVSAALLKHMLYAQQKTQKGIVACLYADDLGVPVLFDRKYIDELLQLEGDRGAKSVVLKHTDDCTAIPFELGAVDLDTQADVDRFRAK